MGLQKQGSTAVIHRNKERWKEFQAFLCLNVKRDILPLKQKMFFRNYSCWNEIICEYIPQNMKHVSPSRQYGKYVLLSTYPTRLKRKHAMSPIQMERGSSKVVLPQNYKIHYSQDFRTMSLILQNISLALCKVNVLFAYWPQFEKCTTQPTKNKVA